jgi:hypothetical protein
MARGMLEQGPEQGAPADTRGAYAVKQFLERGV